MTMTAATPCAQDETGGNVFPLRLPALRAPDVPRVTEGTVVPISPEILARHISHMRQLGRSPLTIYSRTRALARMARVIPAPLAYATSAQLAEWRESLDLTPGAVRAYVGHARCFFSWCVKTGVRADDPAADLPLPRAPRRLPRPIAEDRLMHALDCAPDRIRLWIVLAAWCGLRAKEIALLRVESVLDTGRPPRLIVAADATKGTNEHIVPLCSFVVAEIRAARLPGSGFAFRRCDGQDGANTPALVSQVANRHLHNCGVTETLHQLRHRFGTESWRGDHDILMVGRMMGHLDPRSTAGYMAHDDPRAASVVEMLPVPRPGPGTLSSA